MDWHVWAAVVAGLVLASLADWLFAGILFHDRYQTHPEVWRVNGANPRALAAAQALTIPTVVGLIALIVWTGHAALRDSLLTAVLVWAIAAAPAIIANGIYIKIDPMVVFSHTAGWLAKLALVAVSTSLILGA
jgi:intracellular septation protein A